jgi:hypothetical protein
MKIARPISNNHMEEKSQEYKEIHNQKAIKHENKVSEKFC